MAVKAGAPPRDYADLHDLIRALDDAGLLITVDIPINKDTELHPLVRWQYRGGIPDEERKAFVFANVTDSKGRKFDMPVVVGALAVRYGDDAIAFIEANGRLVAFVIAGLFVVGLFFYLLWRRRRGEPSTAEL